MESLLAPYSEYLARHGITLPLAGRDSPLKYIALSQLFLAPDDGMPPELAEALYFIDELATPSGIEALDNLARSKGKLLSWKLEIVPAEVVLHYWLADPAMVRTVHAQMAVARFRSFEYFQAIGDEIPQFDTLPDAKIREIETELNEEFHARRCGRYARIFLDQQEDSVWLYVAHGGLLRRQATVENSLPASICYRPEVYDALVLVRQTGELGVHTGSKWERELYCRSVGKHLFGDERFFSGFPKYTLDPLWHYGCQALQCADIPGIQSVRLTDLAVFRPGGVPRSESFKSEDLFESWRSPRLPFARDVHLVSAGFRMKVLGCLSPRKVTIRSGNQALYSRDADRSLVEKWFSLRGFLKNKEDNGDAGPDTILAVA
jgi:hypothetical protein